MINAQAPPPSTPRYSNVIGHAMNDSGMIVLSAKDTQNPIPNEVDAYGNVIEKQSLFLLLPMEDGPKVLAVNSDFDEGRIDPATGYAIPDCDDMPGVDLKTGAGNTQLELGAQRNHLDGKFAQGQTVVDDLHKGWFGANPKQFEDEFWAGANVTIRKIDKIDDETGYKESGQVRFYAKWEGGGHYGIAPYDFQTLQPVNLVSGGINLRPGEGVGTSSTIPDGAQFYIEGVRPGKITLEWRMQKGTMDVKHERTFKVETRQSPQKWKADLAYKIRLDTNNDPSGQINVSVNMRGTAKDYWPTVERMSEYYDYYQENYIVDSDYQWSGLARLVGSQVIGGVSDARYALASPSVIVYRVVGKIIDAMRGGAYDIFDSLAWQHHAYRSSGIQAIEWTNDNFQDEDLRQLVVSWRDLENSKNGGEAILNAEAARKMTEYEQNTVIIDTWNELRRIRLENGDVTDTFTTLAENTMKPNGDRFTVAVPSGNLANTADRWKWINDGLGGSPSGIIGAWKAAGAAGQRAFVSQKLHTDSRRFAISPGPVFINDYLDIP